MMGAVLLINMPMPWNHRAFSSLLICILEWWCILAPCCLSIASSWIDFLHELVECPGWGMVHLIQRRTQRSPGLCHHSSDLALEVCVSYLCLKRLTDQKILPARSPGYTLLAGMESSCCLSSSRWSFMTLNPSLPTERCQRQSPFCRGLLLWNLWPPSLLKLAWVKLQRWWKYWWGGSEILLRRVGTGRIILTIK